MCEMGMYIGQRKEQLYKTDSRERPDMFQFSVTRSESHTEKGYGGIEKLHKGRKSNRTCRIAKTDR